MKSKLTAGLILLAFAAAAPLRAQDTNTFKDDKEKLGYAVGQNFGNGWKRQEIRADDMDLDAVARAIKDALTGTPPRLTEPEVREVLVKFQQELNIRQEEKRRQIAEKNKKDGEAFLAENKTKPGVVTLESGLQYKIITEGDGPSPKPEDTVTLNYRGTLLDGTECDSSGKDGKPAKRRVGSLFPGWSEALTHMKVGSKWQLFIPSALAFGERGRAPNITPNSTLIYDVELVSIEPTAPPATSPPPLTSDIIKVPSLEEMKKGAKIETIKAEDVDKLQKQSQPSPEKK